MVRDEDDGLLDAPPEEGWSEDPARLLEDAPILSMFMFLEYFFINRYIYVCVYDIQYDVPASTSSIENDENQIPVF